MLGINVQPLSQGNLTGIGNYQLSIMRRLIPMLDEGYELHAFDFLGRNKAYDNIKDNLGLKYVDNKLKVTKELPLSIYIRMGALGKIVPYEALTRSKADMELFFNYLAPVGVKEKSIITIYDLVCDRFPETMDNKNRRLLQNHLKGSINNASAIMTISNFSRKEIIDVYDVDPDKVFVAPCGIDRTFYSSFTDDLDEQNGRLELKKRFDLEEYILYVGTLEPRKNITSLVKAFNIIAAKKDNLKLVLSGSLGWKSKEAIEEIENSPYKERIVRTGYVSDIDKRLLLRGCKAFIFPSIYEGFGMPVIEAMACGANCVINDIEVLREASGGLVNTCDAHTPESLSSSILNAIEDSKDTKILLKERESHLSKYSWDASASVFYKAIKSIE